MKPSYLITSVHCNLPKNRKQAEIERFFRRLISTTLTQQEYEKLSEDIRVTVSFLNSKYPKTTEYYINTYDKCISVCASGGDKSVYLTFEPIGNSYTERNRVVKNPSHGISLGEYSQMLIRSFGNNAKVALCFLFATLFKDFILEVTGAFPILHFCGAKRTGKSELGRSLTSFFAPKEIAPNIYNYTTNALMEKVMYADANTIVHLDEYKNSLDINKQEFLKDLWDGYGFWRMNRPALCGVVISGREEPTVDIALLNRLVLLTFSKSEFSEKEIQNYEALKVAERRGLTHLTREVIELRHNFVQNFQSAWNNTIADLSYNVCQHAVEARIIKNWATILAAFRALQQYISVPFNYGEMLTIATGLCIEQNSKAK